MITRGVTACALLIAFLLQSTAALAGLGSTKAMYVGGTVNAIKEGTEGLLSGKDEKFMTFAYEGKTLQVPYERINDLEYGQKAGRRLGVAIVVTWMALFPTCRHDGKGRD